MKYISWMILLIMGLSGCGDYSIELGKGYKYVQLDGVNHVISDAHNSIIIFPSVTKYFNDENYIVGVRTESKNPIDTSDVRFTSGYGYFLIDKNTKHVEFGLSREQLIGLLQSKHIEGIASSIIK